MADRVSRWLAEGRRLYPDVELDAAGFAAAVAGPSADDDADQLLGADLYLAAACARGDDAAVRRFEQDLLARIPAWLKLPPDEQEIAAEVRHRVAARALVAKDGAPPPIAGYRGRGPLWAWVRIIALREHARLRRELGRHRTAELGEEELDRLARTGEVPAELATLRARYQPAMMAAFRAAIVALPARERTLLRLAYVDGLSLESIGRMFAVNKSTVSRWLSSCRADLLRDAADRLRAELDLSGEEVESLLGLMPRDLDTSLHGLLGA
jgi:RNA polymerase sigma-70 factor (ECF subfamily)